MTNIPFATSSIPSLTSSSGTKPVQNPPKSNTSSTGEIPVWFTEEQRALCERLRARRKEAEAVAKKKAQVKRERLVKLAARVDALEAKCEDTA